MIFSLLDLSHAYQQVELEEESHDFPTINNHKGLFRYKRFTFGLASAPSIFQRVMDSWILYYRVFQGCIYIDDILVTGGT